jgi:hypothetical protein
MSLPAPCLDNLTVLGELRAVAGRAFDKAKEARDASLMRDCVYLIAELDRRILASQNARILEQAGAS